MSCSELHRGSSVLFIARGIYIPRAVLGCSRAPKDCRQVKEAVYRICHVERTAAFEAGSSARTHSPPSPLSLTVRPSAVTACTDRTVKAAAAAASSFSSLPPPRAGSSVVDCGDKRPDDRHCLSLLHQRFMSRSAPARTRPNNRPAGEPATASSVALFLLWCR